MGDEGMTDTRAAAEAAMKVRMLSGEPWTYGELGSVAIRAGGIERDADRYMQKWRRKGWASFWRDGRRTVWSVTDLGRTVHAAEMKP
jgi:hypothetical protein